MHQRRQAQNIFSCGVSGRAAAAAEAGSIARFQKKHRKSLPFHVITDEW
jgi:hypothetical protein